MKKILLFVFAMIVTFCFSQEKLKITYEGMVSLDESNSESESVSRNFIPTKFELIIDGNLSEFKYIEKLIATLENGGYVTTLVSEDVYIDLKENEYFTEKDIFGKEYLVSDSLYSFGWKLGDEVGEIAGFPVRKAISAQDGYEITAYYAPKLPYKIGPELYGGLPGLILRLDAYTETLEKTIYGKHYKAVKIEVIQDEYKIQLPKGKTISYAESMRIADEHFEKMKEMYGEGVDKD